MTQAIIDLINRSKPDEFIALLLIFGGSLVVALVAIIGSFVYHFRKREAEMNLKREMIAARHVGRRNRTDLGRQMHARRRITRLLCLLAPERL